MPIRTRLVSLIPGVLNPTSRLAPKLCTLLLLGLADASLAQISSTATIPSYQPYADPVHDGVPAWSLDDREILFSEIHTRQTAGHLFRVSPTGGKSQPLFPDESFTVAAAWCPDGKRIAFSRETSEGTHIWISDPQGKHLRQLTHGAGQDLTPAWSPDGKQVAYTSANSTTPQILVTPVDGTPSSAISKGFRPRFSPDGTSLAYTGPVPGWGPQLWAVYIKQIGGGKPRMLASSKGPITGWPSGADWSPDGRQVVYVRHLQDRGELIMIDVASDHVVRTIPLEGLPLDPAWSHDGKKIALMLQTSSHAGEIHVVSLGGGTPVPITQQKRHVPARLISYPAADGQSVTAYLYEPEKKGRHPAGLLWIHGGEPALNSVGFGFVSGIEYFADQGFTVLVPDFRPEHEWSDIQAGAQFLQRGSGVDAGRIGLVGLSLGGYLALLTASKSPHTFAAVVDFFGPSDLAMLYQDSKEFRPVIARRTGGTPDEKPENYRAFSLNAITEGISSPVLILHGTADQVIPIRHSIALSDALQRAGKPVQFMTLTSGHGFSMEDDLKAFPEAAGFLTKHLLLQH